jgi:thiosulfate/3-mercaptopyruvate sulfurtransferase
MPVASLDDMRRAVTARAQVVDMRSQGRFDGCEPEPRPGLRGGHMPGSRSVPYASLVDGEGRLLAADELRALLAARGIDARQPVIATCGSGVSACALILALDALGATPATLYDGSWTEWGHHQDTEIATGSA